MLSLHKGVQAFGVELDSYCERETIPLDFSIDSVGMTSLLTSKLYGERIATATVAACTPSGAGTTCNDVVSNGKIVGCTVASGTGSCAYTPERPANLGPGKHNFVGFSDVHTNCPNLSSTADYIHKLRNGTSAPEPSCALNVTAYRLGIAGHISGINFIGFDINQDGVVRETAEGAYGTGAGEVLNSASGVCA